MWTKLATACCAPRAIRTAVGPAVIAMFFPLGLGVAPASWFLHIDNIEIYYLPGVGPTVMMERSVRPGGAFAVEWTAVVEEVEPTGRRHARSRVVCSGLGAGAVGVERREHLHSPLRAWVVGADCALVDGRSYRLTTTWRFHVLGVQKTVIAQTEPTVLKPRDEPGLD